MSPLRSIIFDFGGVIALANHLPNDNLHTIAAALAEKYHVSPEQAVQITLEGWLKARINPKEDPIFWNALAAALDVSVSQLQEDFLSYCRPATEVIALARELKGHYRVGMLSNQIESWHQRLMREWEIVDLFDPMVTSYGEGIAKPDPHIYERVLEELKLPAEACLYIDDIEANLVPARTLGMQTILCTSSSQLVSDVRRLTLLF